MLKVNKWYLIRIRLNRHNLIRLKLNGDHLELFCQSSRIKGLCLQM